MMGHHTFALKYIFLYHLLGKGFIADCVFLLFCFGWLLVFWAFLSIPLLEKFHDKLNLTQRLFKKWRRLVLVRLGIVSAITKTF